MEHFNNDYRLRNRFRKLNLTSFWRHGTVEFRHHQGTVEPQKAEFWVKLCLRMVAAASEDNLTLTSESTLPTFFATVKADAAEQEFFNGRASYFNGRAI